MQGDVGGYSRAKPAAAKPAAAEADYGRPKQTITDQGRPQQTKPLVISAVLPASPLLLLEFRNVRDPDQDNYENGITLLGCVENNLEVWHTAPSLEYSSLSLYGLSSPIAIVPPSHPAKCPSQPNYPLTNRVQSLVIALAITIIITITISATGSLPG